MKWKGFTDLAGFGIKVGCKNKIEGSKKISISVKYFELPSKKGNYYKENILSWSIKPANKENNFESWIYIFSFLGALLLTPVLFCVRCFYLHLLSLLSSLTSLCHVFSLFLVSVLTWAHKSLPSSLLSVHLLLCPLLIFSFFPHSLLSLFLAFSLLSLLIFLLLLFHMSSLYASPLFQQCHGLFPIEGEVYGYILHCRILEICDKVLNSSFLSRTRHSALSPIFSLHVTSLSFLHPHALSSLLNTSWPLNLMSWSSLSYTLFPSFLRALSQGFLVHHFSQIHSFSQVVLLFLIPSLTAPLSRGLALSPPSHDLTPSLTTSFSLSLLPARSFLAHAFSFLNNLSSAHHLFLTHLLCAIHTPFFSCPHSCFLVFPGVFYMPYFPSTQFLAHFLPFSRTFFLVLLSHVHFLTALLVPCLCFFAHFLSQALALSHDGAFLAPCSTLCDFLRVFYCSLAFNPALSCTHSFLCPPAFSFMWAFPLMWACSALQSYLLC